MLARLHADARLGAWRELLPVRLAHVAEGDTAYVIDTLPPGPSRHAVGATFDTTRCGRRSPRCTGWTGAAWWSGTSCCSRGCATPASACATALAAHELPVTPVDSIVDDLLGTLRGRELRIGWTHGDLHPGNVLVADRRADQRSDRLEPGARRRILRNSTWRCGC